MLDGLEATELKLSEVSAGLRIDAEMYQKIYLETEVLLKQKDFSTLNNEAVSIKKGIFDISADCYVESGIPFIRISNLKNMVIDENDIIFIPEAEHENNQETALIRNDVILSKTAYPAASLVTLEECNTSQDTIAVKLKTNSKCNSHYLVTFFNSRYGLTQMRRWFTGNIQMHLNLTDCKELFIPLLASPFQEQIKFTFEKSIELKEQSKALYAEAESLLLAELGLQDWQPTEETIAVKSFAASFGSTGRLDAEYYHPEKQRVLDHLAKMPGQSVGQHFVSVEETLNPLQSVSNESVQNYDLDDALQFFLDEKEAIPAFELGSTKNRFKKGDILVSRLRSYLKEIALADVSETSNCVGSSEFIVLRPRNKVISAELLLVYLRSLPVQQILRWCQSGSNHPRFMQEDLLSIKIPDRLITIQSEIIKIIQDAIKAHRESKRLLEIAKRGVELAIEQNEGAALAWMSAAT
ncbi:MAG: hypothetical protein DMF64_04355 [Acidobacteria bacterium]|nr:MAG: hypothetical protein DMF64_04355 [Acidobacteriota bacterium]